MKSRKAADNSTFAIGGVTCFYDTFVVKEIVVLRMNICAEKPAHRKSAKRWWQPYERPRKHEMTTQKRQRN